jgi:Ran GTPase-activating protein (RanGAP) involved in mRNA processing and transport/ankyrin repeat protein
VTSNTVGSKLSKEEAQRVGCGALAFALSGLKLKSLNISLNHLGPAGLNELAKVPLTTLERLLVRENGDGEPAFARSLSELLRASPNLKSVDLSYNKLGAEGLEVLAPVLRAHGLIALTLNANKLRGAAGAQAIADVVSASQALEVLEISSNALEDDGAAILAGALRNTLSLTKLDLSECKISNAAWNELAITLKGLPLKVLDLSDNKIKGEPGAAMLGHVLDGNTTLTTLDIEGNPLKAGGLAAMAPALAASKVTELRIGDNGSDGIKGAQAIAKLLINNDVLSSLSSSGNQGYGLDGEAIIMDALSVNLTVTELNIQIDAKAKEAILQRNRNLPGMLASGVAAFALLSRDGVPSDIGEELTRAILKQKRGLHAMSSVENAAGIVPAPSRSKGPPALDRMLIDASATRSLRALADTLALGADVNYMTPEGRSALNVAAEFGWDEGVAYLLAHPGVKVDLVSPISFGRSALHFAVRAERAGVTEKLVRAGADFMLRDEFNRSPLQIARSLPESPVAQVLERQLDMTWWAQQPPTESVLKAVADGDTRALSILLRKPVSFDVNAKDDNGANVILMAAIGGPALNLRVLEMLVDAGAQDHGAHAELQLARRVSNGNDDVDADIGAKANELLARAKPAG